MLDKILAERFIDKISEFTEYNVNIMNEKGIIIASKDKERIGGFHEIAYKIINGEDDEIITEHEEHNYLGVKYGINMAIFYHHKKIGVIGMTGNPDEVAPILKIMRMSVETMLEYELYKEDIQHRKNLKEQFLNLILYGEDTDLYSLKYYVSQLGYSETAVRIPILITTEGNVDTSELLRKIKEGSLHTYEDISAVTREKQIIIFKCFDKGKILQGTYKYVIGEYLGNFLGFLLDRDIECHFYIGTFQNELEEYRKAYQQCCWLRDHVKAKSRGVYFYDYAGEYIHSLVPFMELHQIYHVFEELLDEKNQDDIVELVDALERNNYNLVDSSKELFIHKNTLVFRLNKLKVIFSINPLQKSNEKEFLKYMCAYFKRKRNGF